jgi:hypothetical protein
VFEALWSCRKDIQLEEVWVVVKVMRPWAKQVTFLNLSFLYIKCRGKNKTKQLSWPRSPTGLQRENKILNVKELYKTVKPVLNGVNYNH